MAGTRSGRTWAAVVLGVAIGLGGVPPAEAQGRKGGRGASGAQVAQIEEAARLHAQVMSLYRAGKYDEAIPLAKRSRDILERALGPDHPFVAAALNDLAELHRAKGEYGQAEPLYVRALAIDEKALGPDHPRVAAVLDNLAALYHAKGEYGRAEPLSRRALAIREKALGPDHPDVATSLNDLAELHRARGEYGQAERLHQRALAIREKALGPDHPDVAQSLNNLAALYYSTGDYRRAEPLAQRALAIREKALGPDHPLVGTSANNLAALYKAMGRYDDAETQYRRALGILEKALGPDHPDVAQSLNNLALLYMAKGDYEPVEPLYRRALAIRDKGLGPDHPDVAQSLNNLAALYDLRGDYARAEPLYRRALAVREKALGPDHPDVAQSLNNLAVLHVARGESDLAEPLFQRAIAIDEKALGTNHPAVATSVNNLGRLYQAKGEYGQAEPLYQRAIAILQTRPGPDRLSLPAALDGLASLYWAMGRMPEAVRFFRRAQDVEEETLSLFVSSGSEDQDLSYVARFQGPRDATVAFALQAREPESAALALTAILRRKGRALDAVAGSVRALRAHLGPEEQNLLDELKATRARYANLVLQGPGATPPDVYGKDLDALTSRIQEQLAAISKHSAAFRILQQPVTVAAVQAALPDGAALVEWIAYQPLDLRARTENKKWAPFRYAACVLPGRAAPACVDLGDVETIDAEVHTLRDAFVRPANEKASDLARALERRIMAPVRALLGDTRRVFLSPDGALNLVPFAALIGDDDRPLIERYAFTYLTGGRDLLRLSVLVPPQQGPLILAGPDFDMGAAPGAARFPPLLHADEQAAAAARVLPGATVLRRAEATKAVLQKAHGPRLLHIGTHGYFEPIACSAHSDKSALANPLLRSGIALAGANACAPGHDEGLLTAMEAAGLDLYGTRLVVLSACETGVGQAEAGDGVYGLRRALVLSGAETQVMSLWKVEEATTAGLVKAYYEGLARGGGRSEAMRQAQLALLHDGRHEHPSYWAAFIVSGDDRPLDDNPALPDLRGRPGGACACHLAGEPSAPGAPGPAVAAVVAAAALALARRRSSRGARAQ